MSIFRRRQPTAPLSPTLVIFKNETTIAEFLQNFSAAIERNDNAEVTRLFEAAKLEQTTMTNRYYHLQGNSRKSHAERDEETNLADQFNNRLPFPTWQISTIQARFIRGNKSSQIPTRPEYEAWLAQQPKPAVELPFVGG